MSTTNTAMRAVKETKKHDELHVDFIHPAVWRGRE
jgi:hypothetical protein